MTKVVLELDERTSDRVADVARSRGMSVESIIAERVAEIASLAPVAVHNPSHRALLTALEPSEADGRDAVHDRERARAEAYFGNRKRLLALIDETDGDIGDRGFDRALLYDR